MEPNHQLKEDAALYALDLLEKRDRSAFEKALRRDPSLLQDCVLTEDAIAAISLTAPPQATPDLLADIHAELGTVAPEKGNAPSRSPWLYAGWAAAACLMGGLAISYQNSRQLRREILSLRETFELPGESSHSVNTTPLLSAADQETIDRLLQRVQTDGNSGRRLMPVEALRDLRNKLDRYVSMHDSRFDPVPGLARWVVTEMRDPSDQDSESSTRVFDAHDIANVMAAAIEASDGTSGEPLVLEGGDGRWNGQVKVVNGMLDLSGFNLGEDTVIIQEDFPEATWKDIPSLEQLSDGIFYHNDSDYLYERTPDGDYVGTRPPEDFDPETYAPTTETIPKRETAAVAPKAITYFNEVTGNGSVYVRDLPPLEDGVNYHLWLKDAENNSMISVGPLPASEGNAELVDFPHGLLGTTPSGYLLTRETQPDPPTPNQSDAVLVWP